MKRMHWKKKHLKKMWNRALSLTLAFSMTASLCFVASLLPVAGAEEAEEEPHHHTFACYEKYELNCRENHAEGEHRERCYTYSGELVCGFEEGELHVHNEQECEKVARILVCEEEEGEEIPDEEIVDEETLSGSEEAEETKEETKNREDSAADGNADAENSGVGTENSGAGSVAGGDGLGSGADHTENGGTGADGNETDASETGSDGDEPAGGGTDGSETGTDGAAGNGTDGSEDNGSGAAGSEDNESGSGTDESGAVGSEGNGSEAAESEGNESGAAGSESNGSGATGSESNGSGATGSESNESGAAGSESNGSGATGSESNESGTDGSEPDGSGTNGSDGSGTAGSGTNGAGAAGSGSNGPETGENGAAGDESSEGVGSNYAAFAVSEAAKSYGYFHKMETGSLYLLNHTVADGEPAGGQSQEPVENVQSESGPDENGGHSDNLLSEKENPEENHPGETGEEKKEEREEPKTESESESEEETLESTAEDRAEEDAIHEPEVMEGEDTETGITEASSEAETKTDPDAEENPQESIAKEEMQESTSEGESEEEETSAAETEEEQVHKHTRECYVDIYRCRKSIRMMALQGGRASNEAELLAMISGAENDQETVIQIADNFEISQTVEINSGKDIIIELDGYTLTYDGAGTSMFQVNAGGELKIADSDSEEQNPVITKDSTVSEPGESTFDKTTGELTYYVTEATVNLDGRSTTNTTTRYDVDFGMDDVDISGREAGALVSANPTESLITVAGGSLTIEGGRLTNSGGNHGVLVNGGTVNMTGGYILGCGKTDRDNDGGGIRIDSGTLNIKGGVIAVNKGYRGGGICSKNSNAVININGGIIAGNTGSNGGGLYIMGGNNGVPRLAMNGGTISNNSASWNGGGIYATGNAKVEISQSAAIIGNATTQKGGGIYAGTGELWMAGGYVAGNEIAGKPENKDEVGEGGGICVDNAFVSLADATIAANTVAGINERGGGVYFGSKRRITISGKTIIAGNRATSGGGIYLTGATGADNNINKIAGYAAISNNQAYGNGGGVYSDSSKFELSGNAAVTGNSAGTEGGGIYNGSSAQQKIPIKNNSIIAANTAGDGKSNSIYPSDYELPDTENKNGYMIEETSYVEGIWNTNQANAVTTVQELKDRIKDASTSHFDATVIPLGGNIEIDPASPVVINGGRNIILDLKGYNITTSSASGNYLFSAEGSDSSLTITDSASGEDPEPEKFSEEAGDPQEAGRVGEYENDCLIYYITESEPDGIYTKERTYQYRITPKQRTENKPIGTIDGNGISSVLSADKGACITVEGGMITNPGGKHGIAVAEQSAFMMKGGYIVECGGSSDGEKTDGGGIMSVGSRIQILDGVIAGNKASGNGGGICAEDNQEVLITGGIIAANEADNQGGGLSIQSAEKSSSAATIKGDAVISGNRARIRETPKIEADRGSAYLDRLYGGGGVFSDAEAKLLIQEECYITNNRVERETPKNEKDGGGTGGGGVFSCGAVRMSGGYVTANYSQASGGGVYSYAGKSTGGSGRDSYTGNITLSGGIIAGNYACHNEGGGLRSDWSATIEKTGDSRIYLTNNVTDTRDNWGGGGIFNTSTAFMSIKNVLITENTAHGFGGGIAGCNHGTNRLFVKEGGAIFGNTARGGEDCPKLEGYETHTVAKKDDKNNADRVDARMHVYAEETDLGRFIDYADESGKGYYQDFYCANVSQVNDQMLGGGSAGWRGSSSDNDKSEKSPVAHTLVIEKGGYAESRNTMGLTAYPEQMPSDWEDVAEIYITGNRSLAHGGGVMTNGTFQVGGKETGGPAAGILEIEKKLRDADGKKITGDKTFNFKIQLKNQDGEDLKAKYEAVKDPKDSGENSGKFWIGDGDVFSLHSDQKLTISGLPVAGYRVEEVFQEGEDHYIVEISNKEEVTDNMDEGVLWADEGKKVTFVNIPKQDLTISKVVLKNGEPLAAGDLREADEFEFLLTFTDGRGNPFTGEPYTDRLSCEKHKHAGENMIPITDASSIVQEENRLKVRLHHNECLVVHDLPVGIKYKVEEERASYPLGYLPTSDGNGDYEYNHEQQGSGSIQAGQDTSVKFVNILSSDRGNLAISKKVQDPGGNDILPADTQMFEFTVRLMDTNGRDLPGRYELFDYSGEDSPDDYPDANRATIASGETLRLRQDEEVIIQNLPPGTQYVVTEKPVTGYQSADGEYEKRGVIESAGKIWYAEFFNIKNPDVPDKPSEPDIPDKPGEPEDPTSPTRHPSGGGGGGDGGGGGGFTNPTPPSPTDPALEPPAQAATEPELPEPPQPDYPAELPDPNNPNSPSTITILVNGVPTTYFKYWDPEQKEYVYLLEDQIPLGYMLPDAGEDSHRLLWLTLCGISMAGMMLLVWNGKRERIQKNRKQ